MAPQTGRRTVDYGEVLATRADQAAKEDGFPSFAELARVVLRDFLDARIDKRARRVLAQEALENETP